MVNGSATRVPLPDEPEWDFIDGDFIDAVVAVGAELLDPEI